MANTLMLKSAMVGHGYTQKQVAEHLNLTAQGFFKKLHNKSEFKSSEIVKLCELLNIKDKEAVFFAK